MSIIFPLTENSPIFSTDVTFSKLYPIKVSDKDFIFTCLFFSKKIFSSVKFFLRGSFSKRFL